MFFCEVSGEQFEISDFEASLRRKIGSPFPKKKSKYIFQELGSFWPHFTLHNRTCHKTGQNIISPFGPDCPYPVWQRDEWFKNANPNGGNIDFTTSIFTQMKKIFSHSPIPHQFSFNNQNCEYTDDLANCKNCYLCHSGVNSEDCTGCFRMVNLIDCRSCVFCFRCELCADCTGSYDCFNSSFLLKSKQCSDSAFLFDCRNCSDCLFCWNLRNKKYCIANKQYSKEEYKKEFSKFDLSSRKNYELAKERFQNLIITNAFWRASQIEKCENSTGDYLEQDKNCQNCFFFDGAEDCVNCLRSSVDIKDCVDCIDICVNAEMSFNVIAGTDRIYAVQNSFFVINCQRAEYSAFCQNCSDIFACCGLVGKKFCILNTEYQENEYYNLKAKIIETMKKNGEYGKFFPKDFAPCPYQESFSAVHFPLSNEEIVRLGFSPQKTFLQRENTFSSPSEIPDNSKQASQEITKKVFWDERAKRPFQIKSGDIEFCRKIGIPLPHCFYARNLQENFQWLFFEGELRKTKCAQTGKQIETTLPKFLDGRIISEEAYQESFA
jgi:hypothetical protein